LFSAPLILLSTIVLGTISILSSFIDRTGATQHRLACLWSRLLLAVSFIRVRAEGVDKLDPSAPYVFVCNHASFMDIPAILVCLPHGFRFFAKKGLYRIPFLGTHLKRAGHIPVDRSSARASLKSMTEGARLISERRVSVLLFPEGGRSPHGLREFKEGAAYIAIKAGVPIVPMALVGMREILPMGSTHIRSGLAILRVGDPITTKGLTLSDRLPVTQRLRTEIAALLTSDAVVPSVVR
jgi:1-acyl-sn-glycerol-3-phosphate acyltransferase